MLGPGALEAAVGHHRPFGSTPSFGEALRLRRECTRREWRVLTIIRSGSFLQSVQDCATE